MTTVLNGVLGGLLVGLVAAVVTRFLTGDRSAMTVLVDRFIGGGTVASRWAESALLVLYGGLAGGIFLVLELFVLQVLAVPPTVGEALGVAIAWGGLLGIVWVVIGYSHPSRPFDRSHLRELLAYHLVYGFGFGVWIRFTWIT